MEERIAERYTVLETVGEGSMGVVHRAYDDVLAREVALKELRPPPGLDRNEAIERFVTEARAAAALRHSSIITVYDIVADGDRVVIAMELLDGATLDAVVRSGGLSGSEARRVLTSIAEALAVAHDAGVVHRDLKPENVFLQRDGRVVVCDFGLARVGAGSGTRHGTVMGTPGYLAPEQVRGEPVGPPADVFAWGALAYEVLTGTPAFGDASHEDVATLLWRVVNDDVPSVDVIGDPALPAVVARALAKDPALRPRDGRELLALLASPPSELPAAIAGSGRDRRSPVPWIVGAVVGVLVMGAIGLLVLTGDDGGGAPTSALSTTTAPPRESAVATTEAPTTTTTTTVTPTTIPPAGPLRVAGVIASAQAPNGVDAAGRTVSYAASNLRDGDPSTAWRVSGAGIGVEITFDVPGTRITRVGLLPGYAKVDPSDGTDRFRQNRRVARVRWTFSDGQSIEQSFADVPSIQSVPVDAPAGVVSMVIVESTSPGGRDFVAASEAAFEGY